MRSIRVALHGGFLTYRALFEWLNPAVFLTVMFLTPLLQVLFFSSFGPAFSDLDASFFAAGNALQVSAIAAIFGVAQTIGNERYSGAINNVMITPVSRVVLYVGRGIPHVVIGGLTSIVGLGAAIALTDLSLQAGRWTALIVLALVTTISCSGVGMLFGALGLLGRDTTVTSNLAYMGVLLFSGAAVPLDHFPRVVEMAAHALPMTNSVAAMRHLLSEGLDGYFWTKVGVEAVVGTVWIAVTLMLLGWIERRSRRLGNLDFS